MKKKSSSMGSDFYRRDPVHEGYQAHLAERAREAAMASYRDLFQVLCEGVKAGALSLVECRDEATDDLVAVISVLVADDEGSRLVPLARMQPAANPYAGLLAPREDRPVVTPRRPFITKKARRPKPRGRS